MQPVASTDSPRPTSGPPGADWLQVVAVVTRWGAGAVAATALAFVVQFIGGDFNVKVAANTDKVAEIATALAAHQSAMDNALAVQRERDRRLLALLRAICLGVNRNNQAATQLCGVAE